MIEVIGGVQGSHSKPAPPNFTQTGERHHDQRQTWPGRRHRGGEAWLAGDARPIRFWFLSNHREKRGWQLLHQPPQRPVAKVHMHGWIEVSRGSRGIRRGRWWLVQGGLLP